ncbi:hypothetical protein J1614_010319 [Plenodomus biglobosus]|nr:hypothetical protein J1614_010319 [Plenodomus biglobosus]
MVSSSPTFPNAPPPAYSLQDQPPLYSHSDGYPNTPSTSSSSSGISSWDEDIEAALIRPPPAHRPAAAHASPQIPALPTYEANLPGPALAAPRGPQIAVYGIYSAFVAVVKGDAFSSFADTILIKHANLLTESMPAAVDVSCEYEVLRWDGRHWIDGTKTYPNLGLRARDPARLTSRGYIGEGNYIKACFGEVKSTLMHECDGGGGGGGDCVAMNM